MAYNTEFEREVIDRLARIEEAQVAVMKRVKDVEEDIHGNGRPGLREDVARLMERTDTKKVASVSAGSAAAVVAFIAAVLRQMGV